MRRHAWDAAALGLVLALAWLAHRFVLDLALVGWDSYPAVAASRARDLGELGSALLDRWMGGRYPRGEFYRPLSTLALAVDHAVWGLAPRGYQLGNLLALLFATGCTYGLARAWLGQSLAAAVAALVFALHPAQLEVVPVVARRSDLLATGCMAAALWAQPLGSGDARGRVALGAALAVLAAAAKETGLAVLPAIVALHAAAAPDGAARVRFAVARSLPALLAVLAFVGVRTLVLGGLGGHPGSSPLMGAVAGVLAAPAWLATLVMPQPWTETGLDPGLAVLLLLALVGAASCVVRRAAWNAALAALAAWAAGLLALMGISGDVASWYLVPLLGPYALLLGTLVAFARAARGDRPRQAALAAGVCGLLVASHLATSSLVRDYPAWRAVSADTRSFLSELDVRVAGAADGTRVRVPGLPVGRGAPLERIGIRSALGLSDYSAAAYAELRFPTRRVHVFLAGAAPAAPEANALVVEVEPAHGGLPLEPSP